MQRTVVIYFSLFVLVSSSISYFTQSISTYCIDIAYREFDGQIILSCPNGQFQLQYFYPNGTQRHIQQWTVGGGDTMNAVTVDQSTGNLFATGITFGVNSGDIAISKVFFNESLGWKQMYGSLQRDEANAAIYDPISDLLFVSGFARDAIADQVYAGGTQDVFVSALIGTNGTILWTRLFGTNGQEVCGDICIGPQSKTVIFTGRHGTGVGLLLSYNINGTLEWFNILSTQQASQSTYKGCQLYDGFVYMSGYFLGTLDDRSTLSKWNFVLTRYSPKNGSRDSYSILWGDGFHDYSYDMFIDDALDMFAMVGESIGRSSVIYLTGHINGTLNNVTYVNQGYSWAVVLDPAYRCVWFTGAGAASQSFYAFDDESFQLDDGQTTNTYNFISANSITVTSALQTLFAGSTVISQSSANSSIADNLTSISSFAIAQSQLVSQLLHQSQVWSSSKSAVSSIGPVFTFRHQVLSSSQATSITIQDIKTIVSQLAAQNEIYYIISGALFFVVMLGLCSTFIFCRRMRTKRTLIVIQDQAGNTSGRFNNQNLLQDNDADFTLFGKLDSTAMVTSHELSIPQFLVKEFGVDFRQTTQINKGGGGAIFHCTLLQPSKFSNVNGAQLVVKNLGKDVDQLQVNLKNAFYQELSLLWVFRDQTQFVRMFGFSERPATILLKFYPLGSLTDFILRRNSGSASFVYSKSTLLLLCLDISRGLAYMHQKQFVHCDVKGDNVLLEANGQDILEAKLTDFGISRLVDKGQSQVGAFQLSQLRGASISYAGPDVLFRFRTNRVEPDQRIWKAGDVYALAIVLQEVLTRKKTWSI